MPGWQQFYEKYRNLGFEIVSVAIDVQGAMKVRPWVEKAGATFTTLVDRAGVLGAMFGVNYVPFSVLIDKEGKVVRGPQIVNVADDAERAQIAAWIKKGDKPRVEAKRSGSPRITDDEASLRLARASLLLRLGRPEDATVQLRRALARDSSNWLVRKQIWAIQHPERFYDGPVDFHWQREQLKKERRGREGG